MKFKPLKELVIDKYLSLVARMERGHKFEEYEKLKDAIRAIEYMEDNTLTQRQETIINEHFVNRITSL